MYNNKKIIHLLIVISLLFLSLVGYLTYFELFRKDKIITNSYNRRQWEHEDNTIRGSIFDRNGIVLAESKLQEDKQQRVYPHGSLYSQVIGYNSRSYGKSLLELHYNKQLLNIHELQAVFDIKNKLTGEDRKGNHLHLTIDHNLQVKANNLMKNRNGAVVVMNPKTGEILAMVSKPDFDPNSDKLSANWQQLVESEDHAFLPRATQGLYVPGSTYKVVTSMAAIENSMDKKTFEDPGKITIDGKQISNTGDKAHGTIDLTRALALSSNVVFSQIGVDLGEKKLRDIAYRVGLEKEIDFDIPLVKGRFPYESMSKTDEAAVGIGQGKLLITPLHMAMITSTIANNGIMMKPLLVNQVTTANGGIVSRQKPVELSQVITEETALNLQLMMKEAVENGTGRNAKIRGISVAGKTGTAENELTDKQKNKEHAWFIGFAPVENPEVAVTVILEYSGSTGGSLAAPIARDLMESWINGKH